ncbi:MAG: hypothetical protein KC589_03770, partial [Nanoarchaeota archaeon]|nr:hypothetical protein [Nanoarchaeota archaeon]
MSSIPSQFAKFKESVTPNESIAGLIRKQMKEKSFENKSPKEYFFLTDLCNPTQVYWKFKNPVKVSKSIEKKFALGNKLHDLAGNWFKKINGFLYEEALIDGYYSDLEGVRGKIDFMLNGSIVELKTKEKIPETPDEIISLYPQDLEQVVFYSVLHTEEPDTNYLVFMEDFEPYRIKAYKIIT